MEKKKKITRKEYREMVDNNEILGIHGDGIRCYHDDELRNIVTEIYFAGRSDGFMHAIHILEQLSGRASFSSDQLFFEKNMEIIRERVESMYALDNMNKIWD